MEQKELLTLSRLKLEKTTNWLLKSNNLNDRYAGASPYLNAFGYVLGAHYLLKSAVVSDDKNKHALSEYYLKQILPRASPLLNCSVLGSNLLYAFNLEEDVEF